jgi:hypothetical protein
MGLLKAMVDDEDRRLGVVVSRWRRGALSLSLRARARCERGRRQARAVCVDVSMVCAEGYSKSGVAVLLIGVGAGVARP